MLFDIRLILQGGKEAINSTFRIYGFFVFPVVSAEFDRENMVYLIPPELNGGPDFKKESIAG